VNWEAPYHSSGIGREAVIFQKSYTQKRLDKIRYWAKSAAATFEQVQDF
jgi:hypothetical protein